MGTIDCRIKIGHRALGQNGAGACLILISAG
jgi:hypothetical protein